MRRFDRPTRIDIRHPTTLLDSDGRRTSATLLDVSCAGFRVQVAEPLRIGERIAINDGRHEASGAIKWVLGDEAGGVFLGQMSRPISVPAFEARHA